MTRMSVMQPKPIPWWKYPLGPQIRRRNKAIVRQVLTAFDTGDVTLIDQLDFSDYMDEVPLPPSFRGAKGIKRSIQDLHKSFRDLRFEEEVCVAEGDMVYLQHRMSGFHHADFLGIPASDKWVSYSGWDINRIERGRIVQHVGAVGLQFLETFDFLDPQVLEHPKFRAYVKCHGLRREPGDRPSERLT